MRKHNWLVGLARFGYGARGVVYLVIGGLATLAALQGGDATDSKGAMQVVESAPGGNFLLGLLAAGLVGYSIWRIFQSVLDPDQHGTDLKGLAIRASLLISSFIHVSLAVFAIRLLLNAGSSSGKSSALTAELMQQPWGRWAVGAVGLAIILAGVAHGIKGIQARYKKYMSFGEDTNHWAHLICRFGLIARGLVFSLVGFFFIHAAWTFDPQKARGWAKPWPLYKIRLMAPFCC